MLCRSLFEWDCAILLALSSRSNPKNPRSKPRMADQGKVKSSRKGEYLQGMWIGSYLESSRPKTVRFHRLENFYINCRTAEKLVQLVRVIEHEVSTRGASHFIVYFATCACVDYFYRVRRNLDRDETSDKLARLFQNSCSQIQNFSPCMVTCLRMHVHVLFRPFRHLSHRRRYFLRQTLLREG